MGPFDISRYNDLIQKNTPALEIMERGTSLPNCDWGLDYGLGGEVPVDYARKALALGRLNILYAMHLYHSGNKDGAIGALAAGLRFSHDLANGGSLFATLAAKDLLVTHLTAAGDALPWDSFLQRSDRGYRRRSRDSAMVSTGRVPPKETWRLSGHIIPAARGTLWP
jgi:hypothetical protein